MATHTLSWITNQVGFICVTQAANLSAADLASVEQSIANDQAILSVNLGPAATTIQGGTILNTVTASAQTTLATISVFSGPALTSIQAGYYVYGTGIAPGTVVTTAPAANATTLAISQATTATVSSTVVIVPTRLADMLSPNGWLTLPGGRGQVQLLPGDKVCVTPMGSVFVLPATEFMTGSNTPFTFT